jgi:hypothetical protein
MTPIKMGTSKEKEDIYLMIAPMSMPVSSNVEDISKLCIH